MLTTPITQAELADAYQASCLERIGISLDVALATPTLQITLTNAAKAARKHAERLARASALPYQVREAA
jgi:hypothetical protein